jgi:hypothetical protein
LTTKDYCAIIDSGKANEPSHKDNERNEKMSYKNNTLTVKVEDAKWTLNDMGERGPIVPRTASGSVEVSWTGGDGLQRETGVGLLKDLRTGEVEVSEVPGGFYRLDEDGDIAATVAFHSDLKIVLV